MPEVAVPRTIVILLATVLAMAGLAALAAHAAQQAEGGYFTSSTETISTPTSVLVTDEVLVEAGRPGNSPTDVGDLAEVRIRATPTEPGAELFVGIGPKADVDAYLRGVAHDRMVSFELAPLTVRFDRAPGGPAPTPAAEPFWVATASGRGTQTVAWDKERGAWSAVVMNADGSPGVGVRADVGLRFGFLLPLGIGVLAAGLLLGASAALPGRGGRRNRAAREPAHLVSAGTPAPSTVGGNGERAVRVAAEATAASPPAAAPAPDPRTCGGSSPSATCC